MAQVRINLRNVTTLLVDSDHYTRGLIAQMLRGFGMDTPTQVDNGADAKTHLVNQCPDLCIIEAVLPDLSAAKLISWIRRLKGPIRFVPVIVITGYTQLRTVSEARDGGAHIVVKKPVSPKALLERIIWIARAARPFVETLDYTGPDRRFRTVVPPDGIYKRETDGDATDELSQENDTSLQQAQGPKWQVR